MSENTENAEEATDSPEDKSVEITLDEGEKNALNQLNNEMNHGAYMIGVETLKIRDIEIQILQRKEKLNQIVSNKIELAGHGKNAGVDLDLENGIILVKPAESVG